MIPHESVAARSLEELRHINLRLLMRFETRQAAEAA